MTDFKYMVAPLEDYSCQAFRALCYKYGADLTFTEMVRVAGLTRNNKSTWARLTVDNDTPTQIQILVSKDDVLKKFLKDFSPNGKGFTGFNFNLGCPSPKIINTGQGCALIKRTNKIKTLTNIVKDHGYNVSLKMRLGMNRFEKEKKVYLNLINNVEADFYVVHARHGGEKYSEKADWSAYTDCVKTGKMIIANGDVKTKEDIQRLKEIGVKGAMIGRAAVTNPAIFNMMKGKEVPDINKLREEFLELSRKFETNQKYVDNVNKYIGREETSKDRMIEP